MPYEKQTGSRPPILSAPSLVKTSNRSPLTPRVAGSVLPTSTTPLSRREARENLTTPLGADISTPVSTFLNNNITQRSGSRKSRVDSTNTTPTGTPTRPAAPLSTNDLFRNVSDLSKESALDHSAMDKDMVTRPIVSFSPPISDVGHSKSSVQSSSGDSKFFFASDAKTAHGPRPQLQLKSSSFFYANGESIPEQPQSSNGSAVGPTVGDERAHSKFFHANGIPDIEASPHTYLPPPRASSVVSTSSRMTSPNLASSVAFSPPQRPTSPSKLNQHASMASLRGSPNLPAPILSRPQQSGRGQSPNSVVATRKTSIEASHRTVSHGRSVSFGSPELKTTSRRVSSGSSCEAPPSATPLHLVTNLVPISTPEETSEEEKGASEPRSELQSPVKAGHSIDNMNDLAANARRERKVLDLEITNSSLAAINRTLEREMRKQTTELRRYRRLSRSGRLSIATSASIRTTSGNLSIMEGIEGSLSDMSEEDLEDDSEYNSSEDSMDDGTLSPGAMAESDLRHRKRDEKRLQLDLSKHQQLLIDSQKMNQSLKRCLGWTEAMIDEGKKALNYHVRVSDVELGGRVLAPDEVEDGDNEGMSEVGPSLLQRARIDAVNGISWGGEARDDGDSGIDLEGQLREAILFSPGPS
jgi:hypothetical protein